MNGVHNTVSTSCNNSLVSSEITFCLVGNTDFKIWWKKRWWRGSPFHAFLSHYSMPLVSLNVPEHKDGVRDPPFSWVQKRIVLPWQGQSGSVILVVVLTFLCQHICETYFGSPSSSMMLRLNFHESSTGIILFLKYQLLVSIRQKPVPSLFGCCRFLSLYCRVRGLLPYLSHFLYSCQGIVLCGRVLITRIAFSF